MKSNRRKGFKAIAVDILLDHRKVLIAAVGLLTIVMASLALKVERDPSLKSYFVTGSPAYAEHQRCLGIFGNDEYIIVAIRREGGARDAAFLAALGSKREKSGKSLRLKRWSV